MDQELIDRLRTTTAQRQAIMTLAGLMNYRWHAGADDAEIERLLDEPWLRMDAERRSR